MKESPTNKHEISPKDPVMIFEDLKVHELETINGGGYWGAFWCGYILSEIVNGIQDGLSASCPPDC